MTKAGNTVESMKPKEVVATVFIPSDAPQPSLNSPDIDECAPLINAGPDLEKWKVVSDGKTSIPYNPPAAIGWHDHDGPSHSCLLGPNGEWPENAPQITEEIPPTNLWSLRWRINQLEERVDELCDRIARHNVNSA